jgi:hypothetical protein
MGQAQQTRRAVLIVEGRPNRSQPHPKSSWRPPAPQPWYRCCRRREPHIPEEKSYNVTADRSLDVGPSIKNRGSALRPRI